MSKKFGEFIIGEVFEKIDTPKIKARANDFPTEWSEEYCIPLLTAGALNQGFARYARPSDCPVILNNVITVSANGANSGITFYQPCDFAVLQDAYAIKAIGHEIANEREGLFLAASLNKAIKDNHDWVNKAGWNHIKTDYLSLPLIDGTEDQIDWQYMEERISELEAERISELEAYLIATGLEDYELTEEDKEILASALNGGAVSQNSESLNCLGKWEREFREFRLDELFKIYSPPKKFNANTVKFNGKHPYIARGASNNGIRGYIDEDEKYLNSAHTLSFGQDTATVFYQENAYFTGDKIKIMKLKNHELNECIATYLISVIKKAFSMFSWGQTSFNENIIKAKTIFLPVTPSGTPDYDYMERYIKAMEKAVIADVVRYKDEVIRMTKAVVK